MCRVGAHEGDVATREGHGDRERGARRGLADPPLATAYDDPGIAPTTPGTVDGGGGGPTIVFPVGPDQPPECASFAADFAEERLRAEEAQSRYAHELDVVDRDLGDGDAVAAVAAGAAVAGISDIFSARRHLAARVRQLGYPPPLPRHAAVVIPPHRVVDRPSRIRVAPADVAAAASSDALVHDHVADAHPPIAQFSHEPRTLPHAEYRGYRDHDEFRPTRIFETHSQRPCATLEVFDRCEGVVDGRCRSRRARRRPAAREHFHRFRQPAQPRPQREYRFEEPVEELRQLEHPQRVSRGRGIHDDHVVFPPDPAPAPAVLVVAELGIEDVR